MSELPALRFSIGLAFQPAEHYLPIARAADELGYWAVTCSDHVTNLRELATPYPYTADGERRWSPRTPWLDPWVAIASMAAVTTRLRFTTNVYVVPMRPAVQVAKTVSSAATLSGDRVALGVGMGWCEEEFEVMDQPFRRRGARADEMLEALPRLWSGDWVSYDGDHLRLPEMEMSPPVTAPVPVYVGGLSDRAVARAARHDGWISDLATCDELADYRRRLDEERARLGRADEPFALLGSPKDAVDIAGFVRAAEAGVTEVVTMPWVYTAGFTDDLDAKLEGMARFASDVVAHFDPAEPADGSFFGAPA